MEFLTLLVFAFILLHYLCSGLQKTSTFTCCKNKKEHLTGSLGVVKSRSSLECSRMCLRTDNCRSASFRRNNKTCVLYNATIGDKSECDVLDDDDNTSFIFHVMTTTSGEQMATTTMMTTTSEEQITTTSMMTTTSEEKITTTAIPNCVHGGVWDALLSKCHPCDFGYAGVYCERLIMDCSEAKDSNAAGGDSIMTIQPLNYPTPFQITCSIKWGFTYIARRGTRYKCNKFENFNRKWSEWKNGFGKLNCEYFIGLEKLHYMTSQKVARLKLTLRETSGATQVYYNGFVIDDENGNFTLRYDAFEPHQKYPAGDGFGMGAPSASVRDAPFCSTDRDCGSCAQTFKAGWWYNKGCSDVNLHTPLGSSELKWPRSVSDNTLTDRHSVDFIYK